METSIESLDIKLDVFEGPLDLLLHLINRLEIDIYDIPIATITEQYMRYLHAMKEQQLEIAGNYFVMAATLMAIKSKMLIPIEEVKLESDDDYEDPRQELVNQLLEYQKYKEVAEVFDQMQEKQMNLYVRDALDLTCYETEAQQLAPGEVQLTDLTAAFQALLQKNRTQKPPAATVKQDLFTIEEQMSQIQTALTRQKSVSFSTLLHYHTRQELVYTFLALLELMKIGKVQVEQATQYGEITIKGETQ